MLPTLPSASSDPSCKAPASYSPSSVKSVLLQAVEEVSRSESPTATVISTYPSESSAPNAALPRQSALKLPPLPKGDRSRSNSSVADDPSFDSRTSLSLRRPPLKTFQLPSAFLDGPQTPSPPSLRQESFNVPLHRLGVFDQSSRGHRPQSPSDSPIHHPSMRNLLKTSLSPKQSAQDILGTVDDVESVSMRGPSPAAESLEPLEQTVGNGDVRRFRLPSRTAANYRSSSFSSSLTDEEQASSSFSSGSKASVEYDIFADFSSCSVRSIITE